MAFQPYPYWLRDLSHGISTVRILNFPSLPEFLMKILCLFLSTDAGLVSDTQLIYPLKIAESQMAGWREEEMRCRTRRERGSVVTALQDRKSNADPAHQQPSPLGCRSFAAMLRCPREARPQGYCLSYAPRLTTKLLAPPPAF